MCEVVADLEHPYDSTFTGPAIAFGANQYVVAWTGRGQQR